ncbi:autotransporter-associated beta strand repeat-containing protein [Planctomycetota bacterium]|nr:autotransporter-associated beta strand repeat-containing protein [Planctomycetota bacterium]
MVNGMVNINRISMSLGAVGLLLSSSTFAADVTFFDTQNSNSWQDNANWINSTAPTTDVDGSIFVQSGFDTGGDPAIPITGLDTAYTNINGLEFLSTGVDSTYDLQGTGSLTFNPNASITNSKTSNADVSVDIAGASGTLEFNAANGSLGINGAVDLSAGTALTVTGSNDTEISGIISGDTGSLTKTGDGTLVLNSSNTYGGGTTLSGGTIDINTDNAFGDSAGAITVAGDTLLDIGPWTESSRIIDNAINLNDGQVLSTTGSNNLYLNGDITGEGSIYLGNYVNCFLFGNNSFAGGITMAGSDIGVHTDTAFGTGAVTITGASGITINGVSKDFSNDFILNATTTVYLPTKSQTLSGEISGDGKLLKTGTPTLTLTHDNSSFSGDTQLGEGAIQVSHNNALGTGTLIVDKFVSFADAPILTAGVNNISLENDVTLVDVDLTISGTNDLTLAGSIGGAGARGLIKEDSSTLTLSGTNTYTGDTTINAGTIIAEGGNAIGDSSLVVIADVAGATLQLNGDETIGGLTGGGSTGGELILQDNTLTIGGDDDTTFDGVISGTGSLAITGTGTLALTGTNTFTGGTTLNGGVTTVNSDDAFGTGSVTVAGASGLTAGISSVSLDNVFTLNDDLTVSGDNNLTLSGVIDGTGALTKEGAGTLTLSGTNTYSGGTTISAGTLQIGDGGTTGSIQGDIVNSGTLAFNRSDDLTYADVISDGTSSGALAKTGAGTLVLSGDNTYTGGTTISAGTLQIGDGGTTGSIQGDIVNNGTLAFNRSDDITYADVISGTGSLVKEGSNTLTLSGANTYTGDTTIYGGTVDISGSDIAFGGTDVNGDYGTVIFEDDATIDSGEWESGNSANIQNDINLKDDSVMAITGWKTTYLHGDISGTGEISIDNVIVVDISGDNTGFSGNFVLNRGYGNVPATLRVRSATALGDSTVITKQKGGIFFNVGSGVEFDNDFDLGAYTSIAGSSSVTLSGNFTGSGELVKEQNMTLALSGDNSGYSGTVSISDGTLQVNNNNALGTGTVRSYSVGFSVTPKLSAGAGGISLANVIALASHDLTITGDNNLTFTGLVYGNKGLIKNGSSTLTLSNASDRGNEYLGGTTINAGTVIAEGGGAIGDSSLVTIADVAGATLQLNDDETIGGLTGGGSTGGELILQDNTLTVSGDDDTTFDGVVSGTGSLAITGTGTLTLTGTNTFTGGTTLNGGVTTVSSDDAFGTGSVTVAGASGLTAGISSVTLANIFTLNDTLTISGDNDLTLDGNISGTSGLVKNDSGTLTLNGYNSYSGDTTIAGGTIVLKGMTDNGLNYNRLGTGTVIFEGDATLKAGEFPSSWNQFSRVDNDVDLGNSVMTIDGDIYFYGTITDDDSGSGGGITINSGSDVYLASNTNSFSGGITMNGGKLSSINTGMLGTGAITIDGNAELEVGRGTQEFNNDIEVNAVLTFNGGLNVESLFDGSISGDGSIIKGEDGLLVLAGDNTFTGGTAHRQGSIQVNSDTALGTGALTVLDNLQVKTLIAGSDGITLTNAIILDDDLTVTGDNDLILDGAVSGTSGLIKEDSGTLTLSGTNTYSGDTTINAGTIIASGGNAIGDSSLVTIADVAGAMLQLNADETIGGLTGGGSTGGEVNLQDYILSISGADDTTFGGVISGTGSIVMTGTGTLTLTGANTFTGGTTLNGGVTTVNSDDAFGTGSVTVAGASGLTAGISSVTLANIFTLNDDLTVSGDNDLTLGGVIDGTGALIKEDDGTLTLSGTNTYSGGTNINGGTVVASGGNAIGDSGTVTIADVAGATLQLDDDETIGSLAGGGSTGGEVSLQSNTLTVGDTNSTTFDGVISGAGGSLNKVGSGTLTLGGDNVYTGGTTISEGTIGIAHSNAFGTGTVEFTGDAGLSSSQGTYYITNDIELNTHEMTFSGSSDMYFDGTISGDGSIVHDGTSFITLNGDNTFTGGVTMNGNELYLGSDTALGTGALTTTGSSILTTIDNASSIAIDNAIVLEDGSLQIDTSSDLTVNGAISGDGLLLKTGIYTLVLNNDNTYSGGTTLSGGTIELGTDSALGTGAITVGAESELTAGASSVTLVNAVTLNNELVVSGGNDLILTNVIDGTGFLTKYGDGTLTLSGDNTYSGGTMHYGGLIQVGSDSALGTGILTVDGAVSVSELSASVDGVALDNDVILNEDFTVTGDNDLTLNGNISGDSSFTKEGDGTLTLNGYNDYSGDTTIAGGTIVLKGTTASGLNSNRLGTGTVVFTGDATLEAGEFPDPTNPYVEIDNDVDLGNSVMTIDGRINFHGTITDDNSGNGGSIVINSGSVYLSSSANSFSGGITLNGATLNSVNTGTLGTGTITINDTSYFYSSGTDTFDNDMVLNANWVVNTGIDTTFNGVLSGEGALVRESGANSDVLVLNGDNTYSGGTTLSIGTLTVGHNNALGTGTFTVEETIHPDFTTSLSAGSDGIAIANDITLNGDLIVTGDYSLNLDSVISGTGGLTKEGISTLTLNGQNTYSGDTNINEGTVIASGGDAIGDSSTVTLADVDGATLQLNDDETIGALAGGGSTGGDVSMQDNTLTVGDENNTEFAGVISGTGDLIKQGIGTLTLDGDNTYTGDTTVNGGALIVNGNMASPNMNVASGAMFGGSGYFAGNFTNAGTISPGNSIGTISMMGNLTLTGTSVYDMEIESTAGKGVGNDLIDVDGTADIDGTLNVIGLSGYTPTEGDTFMILEAGGGINGEFSSIVDNLGSFNVEATYTTNDITIELIEVPFTDVVTQPHLAPAAAAFAQIADSNPTGDIATVISQLQTLTDAQLVAAFDQLVPHYLVPQAQATFKGIDVQNNNFNGRLNELRYGLPQLWSNNLQVQTPQASTAEESADPEVAIGLAMQTQQTLEQQQETNRFSGTGKDVWGAWVNGFGTFGDFDSQESQAGFEFNTGGVTLGVDYRVLDTLAAGAFLGYSNTGITVDNGLGTSSFNSINTGMYMTWFNEDGFYASGLFGGGVNFYENNRRIRFGSVDRVAESDPTGFYLQTLATGGYEFKKGNWGIGPQLALQWVNLQIGSHSETGAEDLNLDVGAFNGNSFVTRLGFRATYEYDTSEMLFVPELVGSWEHEYLDPIDTVNVGMPAGGESFSYTGLGTGRDSGLIGVNLIGISHKAPISFTVQYNTEFTPDDFIVSNIYAGVRISF